MVFGWLRSRRRRRWKAAGLTPAQLAVLESQVWQYEHLCKEDQQRLQQWMTVFLNERHWEGCDGLQITDAMKVCIAGQAGLLVLGHNDWYFDNTATILVYPTDYTVREVPRYQGSGLTLVGDENRAGEAWYRGPIVLSLPDVIAGGRSQNHGRNLVVHEFAHHLDMIGDPSADGMPPLANRDDEQQWQQVMHDELEKLRLECRSGIPTLMDCYGGTNPAEFFAVASENYFQRPEALRQRHPQVYRCLESCYCFDPSRYW